MIEFSKDEVLEYNKGSSQSKWKKISVKFHTFGPDPSPEKCETYKKNFQTWTNKCFGQRKRYFPFYKPTKIG